MKLRAVIELDKNQVWKSRRLTRCALGAHFENRANKLLESMKALHAQTVGSSTRGAPSGRHQAFSKFDQTNY
jgi:hypothetical protein